jgi:hypothetical protein
MVTDLLDYAFPVALLAAREYLAVHALQAHPQTLANSLKASIEAAFPAAIQDAKQAFDAGMGEIAIQTFKASMALAGIDAAKEAGFPIRSTLRTIQAGV